MNIKNYGDFKPNTNTLKLAVCVKEVPENIMSMNLEENSLWAKPCDNNISYRMNKFDEYAVEAAIQIKELFPDSVIDIISVGYKTALEVIKRGMGMGCDNGYLIEFPENLPIIPDKVPELISDLILKNNYDIIFTGTMSEDEMKGETGPMIASFSDIPCVTGVTQISINHESVLLSREIEGGIIEEIEAFLPLVLCVQPGINKPRYPKLTSLLKAQSAHIEKIKFNNYQTDAEKCMLLPVIKTPEKNRQGIFLEGTVTEQAKELFNILNNKNLMVIK